MKTKSVLAFLFLGLVFAEASVSINQISLVPELDITRFLAYSVRADISIGGEIFTDLDGRVELLIKGINGEGKDCWDYYADGECGSEAREKSMDYNSDTGLWSFDKIFPDHIYPEIFFADSDITWNNVPSQMSTWRRNYHIFRLENSFETDKNMSFWIEVNAIPKSTINSNPLLVYLVGVDGGEEQEMSYFESDWREKEFTRLVGTITNSQSFHHTHSATSSHHLITLTSDEDKKIEGLSIDGNFFIVLYQDSVQMNRGWDLRYHSKELCNNTNHWFTADRRGGNWETPIHQEGCPDFHIHIARRNDFADGASFSVRVFDNEDSLIEEDTGEFYFIDLPNLPPNQTSFITPSPGTIYDSDTVSISWNPAIDPNDDPVTYDLNYINSMGETFSIAKNLTQTNYEWDVGGIDDGTYSLSGKACDHELCTSFSLDGNFKIDREEDIYSITSIEIFSENEKPNYAKNSDTVCVSFTSTGDLKNPGVIFYSGGQKVETETFYNKNGFDYNACYTVMEEDAEGYVDFEISADNLDKEYNEADGFVVVDRIAPETMVNAGEYEFGEWANQTITVILECIEQGDRVTGYSGCQKTEYCTDTVNGCIPETEYSEPVEISDQGITYIRFRSADKAGNEEETKTRTIKIDSTDPITATVTTPADKEYYNNKTLPDQFKGNAADNENGAGLAENSTKFYIKLDGGIYWNGLYWVSEKVWLETEHAPTTGSNSTEWTSTSDLSLIGWDWLSYEVKAKATDRAGNTFTGNAITFTYDNYGPIIYDTAPETGAFINEEKVSFISDKNIASGTGIIKFTRTGGVEDPVTHTCTLDDSLLISGAYEDVELNEANCGTWSELVSGAIYTVTFNAKDKIGNPAEEVKNTNVMFDNTSPATATVTIPESEYYNETSMPEQFKGNAADNENGAGLTENSTTFYIKAISGYYDGNYWNGSLWSASKEWLETTHSQTTGSNSTEWTSNITMPLWPDGNYEVKAKATDRAGNTFTGNAITFTYDNSAPGKVTDLKSTTHLTGVWDTNSQNNNITLTWTDSNAGLSGLYGYYVVCDTSNTTIPDDGDTLVAAGVKTYQCKEMNDSNNIYFHIKAKDNAGNWGETKRIGPFYIDTIPPTITFNPKKQEEWTNQTINVNIDSQDNLSGVSKIHYKLIHSNQECSAAGDPDYLEEKGNSATVSIITDGNWKICAYATDQAENQPTDANSSGTYKYDSTPPGKVTDLKSTTHLTGVWDTNSQNNNITLTWTDSNAGLSGLYGYYVVCDTSNTTIPDDGDTPVAAGEEEYTCENMNDSNNIYFHIKAKDNAGNWGETKRIGPFYIDTIPPKIGPIKIFPFHSENDTNFVSAQSTIYSKVSDEGSGVNADSCEIRIGSADWNNEIINYADGNCIAENISTLALKNTEINIRVKDKAENTGEGQAITVTTDDIPPTVLFNPDSEEWTGTTITVQINGSDEGSGVNAVYYAVIEREDPCPGIGNESYTKVIGTSAETTIEADGEWQICAYAKDNVENTPDNATKSGVYQYNEGPPVLMDGGSYTHSKKKLVLIFDDILTELTDKTKIIISNSPEGIENIRLGEQDSCSIKNGNSQLECSLSFFNRDKIQEWYDEGSSALFVLVEENAVKDKASEPNPETTAIIENWNPKPRGEVFLSRGWNFISVPFRLEDSNAQKVLGLESDDAVYHYYNGSWIQPKELEALKGYLVYKESLGERKVIYDYEESVKTVPPSIRVAGNNWNMVGPDTPTSTKLTEFLPTTTTGAYRYIKEKVITYGNGDWIIVKNNTLNFGKGYFVYFRSTATIAGSPVYEAK